MRTIEMNITKERFQTWAEWELRSIKGIRDDEDVVISFDCKALKGDDWTTVPVVLDIFKREEFDNRNGAQLR